MTRTEEIIAASIRHQTAHATYIICLFTGDLPAACEAMPRLPSPQTGIPFDDSFPEVLAQAVNLNPAVHDGAIMVGRTDSGCAYQVAGWSFRLFAGHARAATNASNRGSAFNSCLAMSIVEGVDCIYLASGKHLEKFEHGLGAVVNDWSGEG
jgi:hypothetical protein